ncbi:hypothetical protein HG531_010858 [Fusarium graminearum]|nr:hypothetical protein HG531_010858 [Fusarium graminearum]
MEFAVNASSPDVGSSRRRMRGSVKTWIAIDTRRFSPPEIPLTSSPPTRLSAQSFRPILSRTSSARRFFSSLLMNDGRRSPAAKRRVSRTVRDGNNASSSWQTYEQTDRMTESEGRAPLKVSFPAGRYFVPTESRSRRAMALSSDVFPLPEGPMMTFNTPALNVALTGFKIVFVGSFFPNCVLLSKANENSFSSKSIVRTSATERAVIFSLPAERSVSETRARAMVISTLMMRSPITDSTKKNTTKARHTRMGLATQSFGKPRDSIIYAPVYCLHLGSDLSFEAGQS